MLNQEDSQIIDEEYRQLVLQVAQSKESFDFDKSFADIISENIHTQLKAAIQFRRHFSILQAQFPYEYWDKLTERLIDLSQQQIYSQLRYQALCTLVNIVKSPSNHRTLVDAGVIPLLISLIHHENASFRRQAIWGLGNIACSTCSKNIGQEGLSILLAFQKVPKDQKTNEILLWTLAHLLLTFKKSVRLEVIEELLPAYNKPLSPFVNEVWIRQLLFHFRKQNIRKLFEKGTVQFMINCLKSQEQKLVKNCLVTISNIIFSSNEHIDTMVELNLIENLAFVLQREYSCYLRITWIFVSLLQSHNRSFIKYIVDSDFILRKMLAFPSKQPKNSDLKMELCNFFSCIIQFVDSYKLFSLYKQYNFISVFFHQEQQAYYAINLFRYLMGILQLGEKFKENGKNIFVQALVNEGAFERWQQYMISKDQILAHFAFMIFNRFIGP